MPYHVTRARFDELVKVALADVPEPFATPLAEVPIEVVDRPTGEQLRHAGVGSGGLLLGLYQGVPRTRRSVWDSGRLPDVIYIFQQPIEQVCHNESQLARQVRTTVLHEIGHHFGLDEADLTRLGLR